MLLFLFCKKVATVKKVFITFPNQQIEETKMNWARTDHTLFLSQGRVKHHLYASHFLSLHTEHASPLQLTLKNKINRPHSHVRYCEAKACSKSTGYFLTEMMPEVFLCLYGSNKHMLRKCASEVPVGGFQ